MTSFQLRVFFAFSLTVNVFHVNATSTALVPSCVEQHPIKDVFSCEVFKLSESLLDKKKKIGTDIGIYVSQDLQFDTVNGIIDDITYYKGSHVCTEHQASSSMAESDVAYPLAAKSIIIYPNVSFYKIPAPGLKMNDNDANSHYQEVKLKGIAADSHIEKLKKSSRPESRIHFIRPALAMACLISALCYIKSLLSSETEI